MTRTDLAHARYQVASRRWQRLGRCYLAQNGPITDLQWHWIAVRNAGVTAALAGRSATAAAGLRGWCDGLIHVLVQRGASTPPRIDGVKIHWTRAEIDARGTGCA